MPSYRKSYWKTVFSSGIAGGLALLAAAVLAFVLVPADSSWRDIVLALGMIAALPPLLVAASGLVVLHRDATVASGKLDPFPVWNRSRSEEAFAAGRVDFGLRLRQVVRQVLAPSRMVVGEDVEIRSFEEIRRTLDDDGCLDGLPFMPEMLGFCGQRARVFRRVDKIYDYGGRKLLRRLRGTVLLHQLRCNGDAHGDCQAGCYLMWKEAWLKRASAAHSLTPTLSPVPGERELSPDGSVTYRCQFTQLVAASTPINYWDPRLDLRPLAAGNVTLAVFALALLTRLFNYVQTRRGGYTFPLVTSLPPGAPAETRSVTPGELVRIRPAAAIFQTLDKNQKNRGLWFDRDMLKHCGQQYEVLKRVDRIIDDATGRMRTMKTPCIVLKDLTYSGEFLRFLAQEDPLYWREAWLSPARAERQ